MNNKHPLFRFAVPALAISLSACYLTANSYANPNGAHTKKTPRKPVTVKKAISQDAGDPSQWTPNPSLISQLQQPEHFGPYNLRLPNGFTLDPSAQRDVPSNSSIITAYLAKGGQRPDCSSAVIAIYVLEFKPGFGTTDLNGMMNGMVDSNQFLKGKTDLIKSENQFGSIGELKAVRQYFKYPDDPGSTHLIHGLSYASISNRTAILVSTIDAEPYYAKTLPLAEAAALTLHQSE